MRVRVPAGRRRQHTQQLSSYFTTVLPCTSFPHCTAGLVLPVDRAEPQARTTCLYPFYAHSAAKTLGKTLVFPKETLVFGRKESREEGWPPMVPPLRRGDGRNMLRPYGLAHTSPQSGGRGAAMLQ